MRQDFNVQSPLKNCADVISLNPCVVSVCDQNMIVGIRALMCSLAIFAPSTKLSVLALDLSDTQINALIDLCQSIKLALQVIKFDTAKLKTARTVSDHLTVACYARLFLAELLVDLPRVIWLDADTVVLSSLDDLWQTPLHGALMAGVPDLFVDAKELQGLGIERGSYINSGVMVINLDAWRQEQLGQKAVEMMATAQLLLEDQSILNDLARTKIALLPHCWNYHAARFAAYPPVIRYGSIKILHFCGTRKPWNDTLRLSEVWRNISPDAATLPQTSVIPFWRRMELRRRFVFGILLGKRKYWADLANFKSKSIARKLMNATELAKDLRLNAANE